MSDCMHFPDTVEEFMEQYKMTDTKQVYSNGIEYVPIFRMKQWFEHEKAQFSQEGTTSDLISRQAVINAIENTNAKMSMPEWDEITNAVMSLPIIQPEPQWIPVSERLPSKEERKEWIDNNLDGIGYLYPCLVTRYSSINPDRTKNNPYVAKHYFDGEDFLNAGEEVCSEYIIAWMPLPEPYKPNNK